MAKHIIIGGVAGGATAAARLRRIDEQAEIIMIEKGAYISYANCGLPYYIGGIIKERDKLFVQNAQSFGKRFNVDVRIKQEVLSIDRSTKQVSIKREDGSQYQESYDKLLISTGANPIIPALDGIDSNGVFTLRNVSDTDNIKRYIDNHAPKRAVVVGGGFIGLEMAENLHHQGIEVSLVELANQVMAPIDYSLASIIHEHLIQQGVALHLGKGLASIKPNNKELSLTLNNGEVLETDLVLLSIGVKPNSFLAEEAGLELGQRKGIKVNEYMQTSDKDIFAVGDAVEYPHPITGKPWHNYLAGPANRQARLVADNMVFGLKEKYEGSIGTAIAKVFDYTVGSTGLAAKALKREKLEYKSVTIHPNNHAGYYPSASSITLKITFDPKTGKLYGAQALGFDGVDKRIDSIAQILKYKGTIYDLMETEQAYAPPFSSAKDPVALAGYVANNIIIGKMTPLYWREMRDADREEVQIIDVRTKEEFDLGHIEGAVNIPVDELRERLEEIDNNKAKYIYCAVGLRGYLASNILLANGFKNVLNLIGGYKLYRSATKTIDNSPKSSNIEMEKAQSNIQEDKLVEIDACGLCCPGPIMKLKEAIDKVDVGTTVRLTTTDAGFLNDAAAWADSTGHLLLRQESKAGIYSVEIQKQVPKTEPLTMKKGKTLILFSDDLDKALATFVLANGAAATGEKVSIFFTFWGLNAIKRKADKAIKKDFFAKMFGFMLPKNSKSLALSKMNMGGIGAKMMRHIMKKKGVDSLESLRQQALDNGVEFIACQMSMDVMGVSQEELLEEVRIGGVATYMNRAEDANVNLFI